MKRLLAGLIVTLGACGGTTTTEAPRPSAALREESCAGCHPAEAAEWRGSMHRASFTSPDFQRSYRAEPRDYCASCHAPLPDVTAGIGCTSCHAATQQHATAQAHATTRACGSCHDFDVPGTRTALQTTEREHRASAFAATTCDGCHMPRAGTRRDHRFAVSRDRDVLARAIRVHDARVERDEIVVAVASQGVGHRFPTGDLYRRVTVTVTAYAGDALVGGGTFYLQRDVDEHRESLVARRPERPDTDTRLDDTPRDLRIACVRPPGRVHVTVEYERGLGGAGNELEAFERLDLFDADVAIATR